MLCIFLFIHVALFYRFTELSRKLVLDFAFYTCCSVALICWHLGAHNCAQRFYVAETLQTEVLHLK